MEKDRRGVPSGGKDARSRTLRNLRVDSRSERYLRFFDHRKMQARHYQYPNPQTPPDNVIPTIHITTKSRLVYTTEEKDT